MAKHKTTKNRKKEGILVYLKGILMGICDLIPGISGGTIAFITGIYFKLINSIKSFSLTFFTSLFSIIFFRDPKIIKESRKKLKKSLKEIDFKFLIILFSGVLTALFLGSRLMNFLLKNYFVYTISFFIGVITASSKLIFNHIKNHEFKNVFVGFLGILVGILFSFIVPLNPSPSLLYVFIGGFLGVSAMFLPGISGAFILLILGLYKFMINALQNIIKNLVYIVAFVLGAILGAITISRVISFLFKKDKCKTLYFLLGLVLGGLSVPLKKIFYFQPFTFKTLLLIFLFFLLGIFIVLFLDYKHSKILSQKY